MDYTIWDNCRSVGGKGCVSICPSIPGSSVCQVSLGGGLNLKWDLFSEQLCHFCGTANILCLPGMFTASFRTRTQMEKLIFFTV